MTNLIRLLLAAVVLAVAAGSVPADEAKTKAAAKAALM
jgi:hypothetical protein